MTKEKFIMSFSGGKDSILALYRMIKKGYEPIALLTTVKKNQEKSWTHGLGKEFLHRISKSLDIPLLLVECDVNEYERKFEEALIKAKDMGATMCVFGDIDIELHKKWDVDRCKNAGIKAELPLWQQNREDLVYEFIDSGFTTIINKVNLKYMGIEFLGKELNREIIDDIKSTGSDACGENGEYHTFVVDGPLFKNRIDFTNEGIVKDINYAHLNIK
ncbi:MULTISPECIES: diphthine--ammonia ligase [Romboutsia]|uniref:ANH super adenosine nucleotide alpha hydrolase n=1 Tax=Romboutsia ilealis TaxID=1115758 RepID=A0A1V1I2B0_9FIRM|nr:MULTISPECIES: diphthine--ammonia ligase [Romboutsia]CED94350.1 ANH super adenosine nucleotide alpha hydrolase [Romboutsia ilealis]